jgi:hypothetical protein
VEIAGMGHHPAFHAAHQAAAGGRRAGDGAGGARLSSTALKTLKGRGGYGALKFFVNDNSGLYEGSTLACISISIIPLALWLARTARSSRRQTHPPVWLWAHLSALLIPVGTEARTGLLCAGLLALLMMRTVKYRWVYALALGRGCCW